MDRSHQTSKSGRGFDRHEIDTKARFLCLVYHQKQLYKEEILLVFFNNCHFGSKFKHAASIILFF